jgi:LuxR family maltose regulon positive regulatory protein
MGSEKGKDERSDALLRTKLFIPTPRNDLIRRQRLIDLLQSDLQQEKEFTRKLTLISAPAGYGKTTLASQWLAEADLPVAWLTLEASENDPTRFLAYIVAALQTVSSQIAGSVQAMLQAPQRPPQELILTALINELAAHERSILLVLDDYHVIQSPPNHEALNYLVEHLPPNIHLVITTREDPPLTLHRLQARRQMLDVRQAELSFEVDETVTYFQMVSDVDLTPRQADKLTKRTEGWVTGLQLAALSMRSSPDQETFIESFTGSNRYILDYLFEEVFDQQTEEMESFLLQTAILNRICADLADTITERSDSQTTLEQLDQTNFFIVPLDQSREWYRYHRLFIDLLRHRLSRTSIKLEELHERASRWYATHGYLEEAIEHALTGEHWDQAGEYINEVGEGSLNRGDITTLLTWCRRMPDEVLLGRPDWALTYAWPLILIGETEEADRVLQHLKQMVPAGSDALQGEIAAAEAFLSRSRGDMAKTIELSKKALSLLPEDDRSSRGNVAVNLGLNAWHLGLLDDAESALKDALADTQATGNHYAHHTALVFMARTIASRGDLKEAVQIVESALQMGNRIPTAVIAHCDIAAIHFERNQLDSAWKHQEQATAIAEAIHNMEFKSACCVQRALFHLGLNQVEEAKAALEPALIFSRTQDTPPLTLARINSCQVQLALANGDLQTARETLASIPLPHDAPAGRG